MSLTPLKIAPTGMRLHEWIALERGYFQEQGIEPIVRWDIVHGIMARWQDMQYLERPQDEPFLGKAAGARQDRCGGFLQAGGREGDLGNLDHPHIP